MEPVAVENSNFCLAFVTQIKSFKICLIRGQEVMLDPDLAELYGVQTRALKQAVGRNIGCFPSDSMFELNKEKFENLRSQIVISSYRARS